MAANAVPLEDYALIGDTQSAALVGRDGSVDWLCLPRFDSGACFAALLGTAENGRWQIAPRGTPTRVTRSYIDDTLVLQTRFELAEGAVSLTDFMPLRGAAPDVVRIVRGERGSVEMAMELVIRFDYGHVVPWVRRTDGRLLALAGPDALYLDTPVQTSGRNMRTLAEFTVSEGQEVPFVLTWAPSSAPPPARLDAGEALRDTERWWTDWSARTSYDGPYRGLVMRSLLTLKAMTYAPTGGIVAAPTTSLPEHLGGVRNWDYRYCWVRDATLALLSLLEAGYVEEAQAWRDWLLRAVAGNPAKLQIMYGCAGERRLPELELPWLAGYEGSIPVRVGNAAADQFQLDVYGELMDTLYQARRGGIEPDRDAWQLQRALMDFLESAWREPDNGIWEVRGGRSHFTHSKVMAWVAFDRAVRSVQQLGLDGPVEGWARVREEIKAEVLQRGWDDERGTFTQSYGSKALDASLLMIPSVGFLPPDDPRVTGTIEAVRRELTSDGFLLRYPTGETDDGLPAGEGAFLPCSFWLVDALALAGRRAEAVELFERLVGVANDVGLLSEEYDPRAGRLVGNFPQAFSHVALVDSALNLSATCAGPAARRCSLVTAEQQA